MSLKRKDVYTDDQDADYAKVVAYVDAAATLCEYLSKDIKNGKVVTNETVVALSRFVAATHRVAFFLDKIESLKTNLN